MTLEELFDTCLQAPYIHLENAVDYAVLRKGEELYLFFERSNGCEDWRANLDFPAKPYKRMEQTVWRAHRGFLRIWKTVEPHIASLIHDKSLRAIKIVGYSHGAAIAVFCHEYVWYHRPDLRSSLEGYGFGCPRVLWGRSSPLLRKRWENFCVIRNGNDIVTHLPPSFLGYSHVGTMLQVGEGERFFDVNSHREENLLEALHKHQSQ